MTATEPPDVGTAVWDTGSDRVGVVMAYEGPYVQLRPLLGGLEWDAEPDALVPLDSGERLRAHVAELNARSRRPFR
ncbi:hypothetical protein [Streptomyces sp. WMMC897]|uniref:hypothetical protein n=1 Tax=Streptomyces sp. WMMC897 TaxID=3014782 RepID=UPI0022B60EB6|nr:hypothetical protein [Streptomyces sp. WMMC897]MCZ7416026.1 hypothetical protein [Streptomyces sp. WMMC897]